MRNKKGFTLIEILASMGIFTVVALILTQVFVTTTRTNSKTSIIQEVKQNGDFAVNVMTRMIRNANDILSTCSADGTSNSVLTLVSEDGWNTSFSCQSNGGALRIASNTAYLTSSSVTLTGTDCTTAITFTCTLNPDETKSVQINFSLTQAGKPPDKYNQATATYRTVAAVRSAH